MGINRKELIWVINDSLTSNQLADGISCAWQEINIKNPFSDKIDLIVYYKDREVLRINEQSSFFHAMNLRASTSGDSLEVAIFGYFEDDEAIYLIMEDSGAILENSWFTDKAERFLPFKNLTNDKS